jgi:hypothetical protein
MKWPHAIFISIVFLIPEWSHAQFRLNRIVFVDSGWAGTSVNTVVFRKNSIVSDSTAQYVSYYNKEAILAIGSRHLQRDSFHITLTEFKGNVNDAHNSISLSMDSNRLLKLAWDHHNSPLKFANGLIKGVPYFGKTNRLTGMSESKVSYPEFYKLPGNRLLFLYRDGSSGNGNLVVKRYDGYMHQWTDLHFNLISGEGKRNAYWQACVDYKGTFHISWTWRESADVVSNHDICYAKSTDGGETWQRSDGTKYQLPITESSAEYVIRIPTNSELINQTSMTADDNNQPIIASYWRATNETVPQYHVVYYDGFVWKDINGGFRKTAFSLSGMGTKLIPIARPQVLSWGKGKRKTVALVFRDVERGSKLSIASCLVSKPHKWIITDYTDENLGAWEPSYDIELWKRAKQLHLFVQHTEQGDGEKTVVISPQPIRIFELKLVKQ